MSEAPTAPAPAASSSNEDEVIVFSRADLRALHAKPMKEAWDLHVTAAVSFITQKVLKEALAGYSGYDNAYVVHATPTPDNVLEAMGKIKDAPRVYSALETWSSTGKLDPKTGLIVSTSSSGNTALRIAAPCMDDIVAALKGVFPDSEVEFVKAAPASGGKDVLSVRWG